VGGSGARARLPDAPPELALAVLMMMLPEVEDVDSPEVINRAPPVA
jgi:hypothetical protein